MYSYIKLKLRKAQGLVEYALILALVALVAIGILFLVGGGVQKVYAMITAGLGAAINKTDTAPTGSGDYIYISHAECWVVTGSHTQTGLWVTGWTSSSIDPSSVAFYTDNGLQSTINVNPAVGSENFAANPDLGASLGGVADESLCPHTIVVQHFKPNAIAASPITIIHYVAP
jgi:Flp pilus assembly pilin Flp